MTISSTSSVTSYSGDGISVAFPTVYEFEQDADLQIVLVNSSGVGTVQTIVTHYTVAGAGLPGGGTVTMVTAPATGETLKLHRWVDPTQDSNYIANDPLSSEVLENDFDKVVMITQQILDRIGGPSFSAELFDFLARNPSNLNEWDAGSLVLANLAAPVDPNDATTKTYVDAISVAAGNLPTGDPVNNFLVSDSSNYVTNTPSAARTAMGVAVGSDVQAFDAQLTDVSGMTPSKGSIVASTASNLALESVGTDGQVLTADSTQSNGIDWATTVHPLPLGWNTISTRWENAQDTEFSAGSCRDSSDTDNGTLSSVLTKQMDSTWEAGNDAGGLADALSITDTVTYHCFVLINPTTGATDAGFDTSVTATNLLADTAVIAAGHTKYLRVSSIMADSGTTIAEYHQVGPWFYLQEPIRDVSSTDPGNGTQTVTLTIPDGISLVAMMTIALQDTSPASGDPLPAILVTPLDNSQFEPSLNIYHSKVWSDITKTEDAGAETFLLVATNTSAQVRVEMVNSNAGVTEFGVTFGWYDKAGRNA